MAEGLEINNVYSATGKVDPAVGISIAKIAGDDHFGLYCAKLDSFKRVGAHFHSEGVETYHIIEGIGTMYYGMVDENNEARWNEPVNVRKGDVFTIKAGEAHQLVNNGEEELLVVFGSPSSHLGSDRILVKGIEDE